MFGKLLEKVLTANREKSYTPESIALNGNLLRLNPEVYTAWNFRRQAFEEKLKNGGDEAIEISKTELDLTEKALMKNPKSYAAWHHRKWIISWGFSSLEHEIHLVEKLLQVDDRNFHGWSYRRFIAQRMGLPVKRELDYTRHKIEQNFSNYSAWHYRSVLLPLLYQQEQNQEDSTSSHLFRGTVASDLPLSVMQEELEFVKQALYTEPEDQSGWFYHRWLVACAVAQVETCLADEKSLRTESSTKDWLERTLASQTEMCNELLSVEPSAKWPLLTLVQLKQLQMRYNFIDQNDVEIMTAYRSLGELDPMRAGFYKEGAATDITISSKENPNRCVAPVKKELSGF